VCMLVREQPPEEKRQVYCVWLCLLINWILFDRYLFAPPSKEATVHLRDSNKATVRLRPEVDVAKAIHTHQNPARCDTATYFMAHGTDHRDQIRALHNLARQLVHSMQAGRVLILERARNAEGAGLRINSLSNCTQWALRRVPSTRHQARLYSTPPASVQVAKLAAVPACMQDPSGRLRATGEAEVTHHTWVAQEPMCHSDGNHTDMAARALEQPRHHSLMDEWHGKALEYIVRPLLDAQHSSTSSSQADISHTPEITEELPPLVAVHVSGRSIPGRRSGHWLSDETVDGYLRACERLLSHHSHPGPKSTAGPRILVTSDGEGQMAVAALRRRAPSTWQVYHPSARGRRPALLLHQLDVALQACYFVCVGSNSHPWCRLVNALRRMHVDRTMCAASSTVLLDLCPSDKQHGCEMRDV
jgi:hypothetical protein